MCLTTHYISRNCGHHWLAIRQPCWPGYGFNYCGAFGDGVAREPSPELEILGLCPACATSGGYDYNLVRMVVNVNDRCRWGIGPSRGDTGVECVVMQNLPASSTSTPPYTNLHDMLPTPDTSHAAYERVYEPAEDSFLLLDVLSSPPETAFLQSRFQATTTTTPSPLVIEIGPGSGVVIAFLTAHASTLFGTRNILTGAVDMNPYACAVTEETVRRAVAANTDTAASTAFLGAVQGDLAMPLRNRSVDVLVFNPPYVPTAELPSPPEAPVDGGRGTVGRDGAREAFEEDSYLLALSYAGGRDGMETTDRLLDSLPRVLSDRGCAYVLLCAQNKPAEVKERVRRLGGGAWKVETVGSSGKQAGWEKLQIIRIWRDS
ncbi:methyltransferase domain-containing protein [Nemania abortiva]|nr:methyltransferase domain-containing protein [Nemania abortiva]